MAQVLTPRQSKALRDVVTELYEAEALHLTDELYEFVDGPPEEELETLVRVIEKRLNGESA